MLLLSTLLFALSASASPVLEARQASSSRFNPAGPNKGNWETVGCANDLYPNSRAMNGGYLSSNSMTISTCLTFCQDKGAHLAGLENGDQCYCSATLADGSSIQTQPANLPGACTSNAAGNGNQSGGGSNAILLFQSKIDGVPSQAKVANATYQGCYPDSEQNRVLPNYLNVDGKLTTEKCLSACTAAGYDLCGLEYSTQCFGAVSSASRQLPKAIASSNCQYTCDGNHSQLCGGSGALAIYKTSPAAPPQTPSPIVSSNSTYTYLGCYTDRPDSQGRALTGRFTTISGNSLESCVSNCAFYGFKYAAAEYGTECRCGNELASFSKPTANCDVRCPADSAERCGGSNYAMTLYEMF